MRRPVDSPYTITTEFGVADPNALFKYHSGVDYGVKKNTNVYSPVKGKVIYARFHDVRGNMVGIFDGTNTHRLMHNTSFAVSEGDNVAEGQLVAQSGTTGLSTGPHVHWDIIKGNKMDATSWGDFIDPASLLFATPAPTTPQPVPITDVLQPWQRRTKVNGNGVNRRSIPSVNGQLLEEFNKENDIFDFKGYVKGEAYSGNDVWFVGRYGNPTYFWSGAFSDPGTSGLADLTSELFPPAPSVPEPTVPVVQYSTRPSIAGLWAVDVSSHQKSINFTALKEQGVEIAVLKAGHTGVSYGGNANKTDPKLYQFQADARAAGLAVGYYWYCYFDEDAETEAGRFVASVGAGVKGEPLFADVEEVNGAKSEWLTTFVETVEQLSGRPCHIYTYTNYLQNQPWVRDLITGVRELWLAHYDIPAGSMAGDPVMHQYTSKGTLRGVESEYIDLNVFFGNIDEFKRLGDNMPVVNTPSQPATPDPLPNNDPPAPLPTPDNNPVRTKVKWGAIAGVIVSVLLAALSALAESPELLTGAGGALITTLISFLTAYQKRDGLSPK